MNIKSLGNPSQSIEIARKYSPYIDGLCVKFPETLEFINSISSDFNKAIKAEIENCLELARDARDLPLNDARKQLRHVKAKTHLLLCAGDLSQTLKLHEITFLLSKLADIAVDSALHLACIDASPRDLPALIDNKCPGLFILAMGKHGAHELNYSSDIDLIAFFDRDKFAHEYIENANTIATRIVGATSKILEEITGDNYVFRIDWRLRPDPSSTPLAVSVLRAESYYESVGQNWERAAFIKARFIAGDIEASNIFLKNLEPFIWRKYLDHAAVIDVGSILKQIHSFNKSTNLDNPSFNVKLGRGGIREIEFFAQTQQLILGGKDKNLRSPETIAALAHMVSSGRLELEVVSQLADAYEFLRNIEHRIQMLDDEQTHILPEIGEKRLRVAKLAGFSDLDSFDKTTKYWRSIVNKHIKDLFPESPSLESNIGSLVFTGVEPDLETVETLANLGFKSPQKIWETIKGWHHGRIRATRTPRARELLTSITPYLIETISKQSESDLVFSRFDDFFSGLNAGVQTLALFQTEPEVLAECINTLALSPRLAASLSKKPAILDAMLSPRFKMPLSDKENGDRLEHLNILLSQVTNFEIALDTIRRFYREEEFRIGHHVLNGLSNGNEAAIAYTDLATSIIKGILPFVEQEVCEQHGKFNGEYVVCGWGKLSGMELAADSDLDIMLVYKAKDNAEYSDGAKPLSPEQYYAKITQKLVMALSVATPEGQLYEVDMQLRPSGKKGPVAVRFSSFETYYNENAWTWEFQALTRLKPIAGSENLFGIISDTALKVLEKPREKIKTIQEIIEMREKIRAAMPPRGPWDLKRLEGGIIELEFSVQAHELINACEYKNIIDSNTIKAIEKMSDKNIIDKEKATRLINAANMLNNTRQILAIIAGPDFDPSNSSETIRNTIAQSLNFPDFSVAEANLNDARILIKEFYDELKNTIPV